ncbi:metal-dependent hydrolase [Maioricimonas sp. JC845]|uniref:metal-dependent hydrolase n=1 Tax=Maioricimonas sp. JC845 TaxID=3232138 RepID=UPI00345AA221
MKTPSHLLMTVAAAKRWGTAEVPRMAVWLGAVAPDLPLYVLTFSGLWFFHYWQGWTLRESARHIFGTLYFSDPGWIACHNLLHSPTSLAMGLVLAKLAQRRWPRAARWWTWFLVACLFHSVVDILTHHDDGPLLFWPIDWTTRFASPVSYWDPAHFGREFSRLELALDVVLLAYLVWPMVRSLWGRTDAQGETSAMV